MAAKPLHIEAPEAYELASQIAEHTGKTLEDAVVDALRREKERIVPRKWNEERIQAILSEAHALPDLDPRPVQAIFDDLYDEDGLIR